MLRKSAWLLRLNGDKASPTAGDSNEDVHTLGKCCCPHSSSLFLIVEFYTPDEVTNVARSSLPLTGNENDSEELMVRPAPTRFPPINKGKRLLQSTVSAAITLDILIMQTNYRSYREIKSNICPP